MGRKSRHKRERRARTEVFSGWDGRLLRDALGCAASAPGGAHRAPTLTHLLATAYAYSAEKGGAPTSTEIIGLVDGVPDDLAEGALLEERAPLDPAVEVLATFGSELLRLHPGPLANPVQEVERLRELAWAIDPVLVAELGFGLADLLEFAVRLCDAGLAIQAPRWVTPLSSTMSGPLSLTDAEVEPARVDLRQIVGSCAAPDRAERALAWGTRTPASVSPGVSLMPGLGSALAVRTRQGVEPLPPCLLIEACLIAARDLAQWAARVDRHAVHERRHHSNARMCALFGADPRMTSAGGGTPLMLASVGTGSVLAAGLASELEDRSYAEEVRRISHHLSDIRPGGTLPPGDPAGTPIPANARICKLLVSAGAAPEPGFLPMSGAGPGVVVASIEDLEMMEAESDDADDLVLFLLDAAEGVASDTLMYSSIREAWSIWRANGKAFHRAGAQGVAVFLSGLETVATDWAAAGARSRLLRALARAGFLDPDVARDARLRRDEVVARDTVYFVTADRRDVWGVSVDGPPVCVGMRPRKRGDDAQAVSNLSSGLMRLLLRPCGDALVRLSGVPEEQALRILLIEASLGVASSLPLSLGPVDALGIELFADTDALLGAAARDQDALHTQLIELLADGAEAVMRARSSRPTAATERSRWIDAARLEGPHFGAGQREVTVRSIDLPAPARPHDALAVAIEREVGARLQSRGIALGTLHDEHAVRLIGEQIFPVYDQALVEACEPFLHEDLVGHGLAQLEMAGWAWESARGKAQLDHRQPWRGADWEANTTSDANDAARLRRAIGTVLERAVARPSGGTGRLMPLDWRRILTIADRGLAVGVASEAAHHGLAGLELEIEGFHELRLRDRAEDGRIDLTAWNGARAREVHVDAGSSLLPALLGQWRARIDEAMVVELGCGLDVLLGLLVEGLSVYPVAPPLFTARATREEIAEHAAALGVGPPEQVQAAIELLVMDPGRLPDAYEPWDQFAQSVRLLSHPLVPLGSALLVGPWTCAAAGEAWLTHISQGRLPWPDADSPEAVMEVLKGYLQARNELLEEEAHTMLVGAGFAAKKRIKKPKLIGLPALRGEIDVLFADTTMREIIVLEAKDPQRSFAAGQIARSVNRLLGRPGRPGDGELAKLETKVAQVSEGIEAVVSNLGVDDQAPWTARGVVLTRHPVPAAYVRPAPPFPFVTLADLRRFVDGEESRGLGL